MNEVDLTSPLKSADVVTVDKEEALEKFNQYRSARGRAQHAADNLIMQTYKALAAGHGVINVPAAVAKAGVNADCTPKLAIMRADFEAVYYRRWSSGAGVFSFSERYYLSRRLKSAQRSRQQFCFPEWTFGRIPAEGPPPPRLWSTHTAPLPIIPPQYRPADALSKYCVLWEVEKWEPREPPADPMLLRPLGQTGLYVVLAHWDLTPVERMVLGGLLGQ